MVERCALLLRAVNVGGTNRVPMAELRTLLAERTELGRIATYIASGNVIADVPGDVADACAQVHGLIHTAFGADTPVIARTHEALVAAMAENPFPDAEAEKMLHVMFLEGRPRPGAEEALRERLQPGERIALVGQHLWIDYGQGGVANTKLARPLFDRTLGVAGTARNVLTLRKLIELTA